MNRENIINRDEGEYAVIATAALLPADFHTAVSCHVDYLPQRRFTPMLPPAATL